jgi:hypothetical protein
MNLSQLKTNVLKLIAEYSNNGIAISQGKNADYLNRVIPLANAGMTEITTLGKRKSKTIRISQNPIDPIAGRFTGFDVVIHKDTDIINNVGLNVNAYYFEVDNTATVYVEEENPTGQWNTLQTIQNTVKGQYTTYKGLVSSTHNVRLRFSGPYLYNIKNIALFNTPFETVDDIPDYKPYVPHIMPTDFYMIKEISVDAPSRQYSSIADVHWQDQQTLLIGYYYSSQLVINYYAYPTLLSDTVTDDTELDLDQLASQILPYYVSAYVKNDEDVTMSAQFLNIYETKLARLNNPDTFGISEIISTNNW